MSKQIVRMTISPEGEVQLETEGFQGEECMSVTENIQKVGVVGNTEKTSEYYDGGDEKEQWITEAE